jgi:hypothetical protein
MTMADICERLVKASYQIAAVDDRHAAAIKGPGA